MHVLTTAGTLVALTTILQLTNGQDPFTSKISSTAPKARCLEGCLRCDESFCFECAPEYQRTGYTCAPISEGCKDSKCKDCSDPVCYKCFDGYAITDESGLCKWIGPQGCDMSKCTYCPESKTQCAECKAGLQLRGQECRKKGCLENNCMACDSSGETCLKCQDGFQLRKGACLEVGCIDENCLSCSPSGGTCYECEDGHRVTEKGECSACPDDCKTCVRRNGADRCTVCGTGFYLKPPVQVRPQVPQRNQQPPVFVGGGCFKCEQILDDCAECAADGTVCHRCNEGFYLEEGNCIACPEFCKACKSPWFCDFPMEGYLLSGQGKVVKGEASESSTSSNAKLGWSLTIGCGIGVLATLAFI
ncbi:hypothetical protein BSKO_07516 [Bryopsis sp. KO-2023]|nr:hypothetical protein BSKO_07516 [Bryopsis sp. KO-2023]